VAIIERYQGYHRIHDDYSVGRAFGFHPLSALRDLASMDKHKMLIRIMTPTALLQGMSWSPFSVEILELMQECASMMAVIARPLELGAEVCRVKVHGALQSEMDVKGYITPEVTLGEGQPIVHVVDRIAPVVIKIIREFEPFF